MSMKSELVAESFIMGHLGFESDRKTDVSVGKE